MANQQICAGNWKANGSVSQLREWARDFDPGGSQAIVCVPHPLLLQAVHDLAGKADVAAQDVSEFGAGSWTGYTAAELVAACGARWTLIGHSERRSAGETDRQIAAKMGQAASAGLGVILCVGESLDEREAGQLEQVLAAQLEAALEGVDASGRLLIAYEPVWAIGTGVAASADDAAQGCAFAGEVAEKLLGGARIPLLYGGSVKPGNTAELALQPAIDGMLVGGASLEAASFSQICAAATGAGS